MKDFTFSFRLYAPLPTAEESISGGLQVSGSDGTASLMQMMPLCTQPSQRINVLKWGVPYSFSVERFRD